VHIFLEVALEVEEIIQLQILEVLAMAEVAWVLSVAPAIHVQLVRLEKVLPVVVEVVVDTNSLQQIIPVQEEKVEVELY
jgi:hypothetical protein